MVLAFSINEAVHQSAPALKASDDPPVFFSGIRDPRSYFAVEHQLRMLQTSVDNASYAILITEADPADEINRRILYANKAFAAMTGCSVEEVLGQTVRSFQERCTNADVANSIRWTSKQSRSVRVELLDRRSDGRRCWLAVNIMLVATERKRPSPLEPRIHR